MKRKAPLVQLILDGVGIGRGDSFDAWAQAKTPTCDALFAAQEHACSLFAHGHYVGLPSNKDLGNSEVGHNALGAGRIVAQGATLVADAIANETITHGKGWAHLRQGFSNTLHFLGLLSDGNIHSHIEHLFALSRFAKRDGAQRIRYHVLLDGRDVPDRSALTYIEKLERFCRELRDAGCDARIASGGGRMHVTMDRYEADWKIVKRGYDAHILGQAEHSFQSAGSALTHFYKDSTMSDQYLPAFVICDDGAPVGRMQDGDALCCFNFRGDRVIEISRALEESTFHEFERGRHPQIYYAGLMQYDGDLALPSNYLVSPPVINQTSGELIVRAGLSTFATSETHKFGHVTYFWNGNRSGKIDEELEEYYEVPSLSSSFKDAPEMRAAEISQELCAAIERQEFDYLRANIANGDMIGHTGSLSHTIQACEHVDAAVARIQSKVREAKGILMVTADHGNCDDMVLRDTSGNAIYNEEGEAIGRTSHTLAKVPFALWSKDIDRIPKLNSTLKDAGLANVTSTVLHLLNVQRPSDYADSLLEDQE